MSQRLACNLELRDFGLDGPQRLLFFDERSGRFQAIVVPALRDNVSRAWPEVLARFAVDALTLVTAVIDPFLAAAAF